MKKIFVFILLLFTFSSFSQGHYKIFGNSSLNINGFHYGDDNNGDSIWNAYTDRFKLFKPIVLPQYATGSEPSIPWSVGFDGDSATNALWYRDGSSTLHRFGSIGGSGGGGGNPFADNSALVKNSSDATKLLILSAASISTATTRTWTFPDVNGTVARNDAAQTFTGIQTFANKTLFAATTASNASLNIPSGTIPTSPNDGDIFYDGTHFYVRSAGVNKDLLGSSNAFVQGGNAFGADATIGTTDAFNFIFKASNAQVMEIFTNGHIAFGNGAGGNPTQFVYFPGTSRFDGSMTIGANGGLSLSSGVSFTSFAANNASNNAGFYWTMNNNFNTGGTNKDFFDINGATQYTSGTGETVTQINMIPTINNTGGTGHVVVGINFNPTLTSVTGTSLVAFKNVVGDNNFNTTSGTSIFNQGANFSLLAKITGGAYNNVIGSKFLNQGAGINNPITAASGTVVDYASSMFDIDAQTATNATVTYTNASTVYIAGAPTASTNITITNPFSLKVAAGKSQFNGIVQIKDGTQANNSILVSDANGNASWSSTAAVSASFTSTLTNTTNITSSTFNIAYYQRIGNIVHVMISGQITPTSASTISTLTFTLPFTTSVTSQQYVGGGFINYNNGAALSGTGVAQIVSSTTGQLNFFTPTTLGSSPFSITFDYTL